jgi:capsular polysaccharide transport system permease protein
LSEQLRLTKELGGAGVVGEMLGRLKSIGAFLLLAFSVKARFLLIFVIPVAAAIVYYVFVASDIYVSSASYLVRGVNSHRVGGLGSLLNTIGISRTADDTSAIEQFVVSRDAIREVDKRLNLRTMYGRRDIDFLSRLPHFWQTDSFEAFYDGMQSYVSVTQDQTTGISKLTVRAFRAADAKAVADVLLRQAEQMVNQMNGRAQEDSIGVAKREVQDSRRAVLDAEAALTEFRKQELMVDPVSYSAVLLQTIAGLMKEKSSVQSQVSTVASLSPSSPSLSSLNSQAKALDDKINDVRAKLAGGNDSLSGKLAAFDQLALDAKLAEQRYGSALVSLQNAQLEAQRQQVYLEEVVAPGLPDLPIEPESLRGIATIAFVGFATFSMLWILAVGAKDHAQ